MMKRGTLDDILQAEPKPAGEEFELPDFGISVLVRGLRDYREHVALEEKAAMRERAADKHVPIPGTPSSLSCTPDEASMATWIEACVVDPPLSYEACLQLFRKDGGTALRLFRRVMELSNRTDSALKAAIEALRSDPFSLADPSPVAQAPAPAPD